MGDEPDGSVAEPAPAPATNGDAVDTRETASVAKSPSTKRKSSRRKHAEDGEGATQTNSENGDGSDRKRKGSKKKHRKPKVDVSADALAPPSANSDGASISSATPISSVEPTPRPSQESATTDADAAPAASAPPPIDTQLVAEAPTEPASSSAAPAPVVETSTPIRQELTSENTDMYGFLRTPEQIEASYSANLAKVEKQRSREVKWSKMLGLNHDEGVETTTLTEKASHSHWEAFRKKNARKVQERCRKGIPNSIRGKAWVYLAESYKAQLAHTGDSPFNLYDPAVPDKMELMGVIDRDIDRCFPEHQQFRNVGSQAQRDLERILKSYALFNPAVGYCQGMGMIVGMMLMNMTAEDAFWLLVVTCDNYLRDFFVPGLTQVRVHAEVLRRLLAIYLPQEAAHLDKHSIEPLMYCTGWFMTAYTTTLPWATVLRIWDILYCEGNVILLRVAVAIIKTLGPEILKTNNMQDIFDLLLHLPESKFEKEAFIKLALTLKMDIKVIESLKVQVTAETR